MRTDSDMLKNPSVPDHRVFRHSGGEGRRDVFRAAAPQIGSRAIGASGIVPVLCTEA
jgi:hypothetical protein